MHIAITGATGHVGAVLAREWLSEGAKVRALVFDKIPSLDGLALETIPGDVLNPESLMRAFDGVDIVYHLAAVIPLDNDPKGLAQRVNVGGTRNVIEACRASGIKRLVHFSSIHALDPHPMAESIDETRPLNLSPQAPAYDRSKVEAELLVKKAVQENALDAVILNPTGVIGPFDFARSHMGGMLLDLYHRRVPALVQGGFNWIDVRDVARSALLAGRKGKSGERYLLAGHYHTVREVAQLVTKVTGIPGPRIVLPMGLARRLTPFARVHEKLRGKPIAFTDMSLHALCHHQVVDGGKAIRELGHRARSLEETLTDTFAWYSTQGWLKPR